MGIFTVVLRKFKWSAILVEIKLENGFKIYQLPVLFVQHSVDICMASESPIPTRVCPAVN